MNALDFPSALARLLRDGALRERFAADPSKALANIPLNAGDRSALLGLAPAELELQATILLRKRFDAVQRMLPVTCANLGESAWPIFQTIARYYWPNGEGDAWADANTFGERLETEHADALSQAEKNRIAFATGAGRMRIHMVRALPIGGRCGPALQIFWRGRGKNWRELVIFPGL